MLDLAHSIPLNALLSLACCTLSIHYLSVCLSLSLSLTRDSRQDYALTSEEQMDISIVCIRSCSLSGTVHTHKHRSSIQMRFGALHSSVCASAFTPLHCHLHLNPITTINLVKFKSPQTRRQDVWATKKRQEK